MPEERICKTCRHWQRADNDSRWWDGDMCSPRDPDTGEDMDLGFEVRVCRHPSQTFCETPVERNGFGVADGSNYRAILATAEEFGCVRWES